MCRCRRSRRSAALPGDPRLEPRAAGDRRRATAQEGFTMLRSLFSGISGLRAHQTMMDVTGNNIANVNTTGYKTSQTVFQDTLSQMLSAPGAAQPGVAGGTNPAQV